jgi:hypothetical protein
MYFIQFGAQPALCLLAGTALVRAMSAGGPQQRGYDVRVARLELLDAEVVHDGFLCMDDETRRARK